MRNYLLILLIGLNSFMQAYAAERHFPVGTDSVMISNAKGVRSNLLKNIAPIVQHSIAAGEYPGAVIIAGHDGKIIYKGVFGNRQITPDVKPLHANDIFDLASLTKVVATTPAIMQLVEQGKISLEAPVATYWPEFANNGKKDVTVRELLTHTSGLEPDISIPEAELNKDAPEHTAQAEQAMLEKIANSKLLFKPGTKFLYSDLNFMTLGYLVERVSHQSLDRYTKNHIFQPLGMSNTTFLPTKKMLNRIVPTDYVEKHLRLGEVEDPNIFAMGGVGGSAGLFSNALDLSKYAQCLLNGGKISRRKHTKYLMGPLSVLKMTRTETPENLPARGLGWDVDSYFTGRGILFSNISYGHTGWTGTSLWIDPATRSYLIILTSRLHPNAAKNNGLITDRRTIANIVAASLTDVKTVSLNNTDKGELLRAYHIDSKH